MPIDNNRRDSIDQNFPNYEPAETVEQPAFSVAADQTLADARATYAERGDEYADSWALHNQVRIFQDLTMREILKQKPSDPLHVRGLTDLESRLIRAADQADTKLSRLLGGFKYDSLVDLINYVAVFAYWMRQYRGKAQSVS